MKRRALLVGGLLGAGSLTGCLDFAIRDPEKGSFQLTSLSPEDASISREESLEITTTIENRGETDAQAIDYRLGSSVAASQEVSLDGGEETTVTFDEIAVTDFRLGEYPQSVHSRADEIRGTVTITAAEPESFAVTDFAPLHGTLDSDGTIDVTATIKNNGTAPASQSVSYQVAGLIFAEEAITLEPGESATLTFEEVEIDDRVDWGEKSHAVVTEDDERRGTLSIPDPAAGENAYFAITDMQPQTAAYANETAIDVRATIKNTGGTGSTQQVSYWFDGSLITETAVTLNAGQSTEVRFDPITLTESKVTHRVITENEEQSGKLFMEAEDALPAYLAKKGFAWYSLEAGGGPEVTNQLADEHHGTIEGEDIEWVGGDWVAGGALRNTDTGSVEFGTLGSWGDSLDSDFSIAYTIESHDEREFTTPMAARAGRSSSDAGLLIWANVDGDPALQEQAVGLQLCDGRGNEAAITTDDYHLEDGPHRVVITKTGVHPDEWIIAIDGTPVATATVQEDVVTDIPELSGQFRLFGLASGEGRFAGVLDDIVLFNEPVTEDELLEDYQRQPFAETHDGVAVEDLVPNSIHVEQDDMIDVSAVVTNTTASGVTQQIAYRVGGVKLASQAVHLESGETATVSFEEVQISIDDFSAGNYTHGIFSEDDASLGELKLSETTILDDPLLVIETERLHSGTNEVTGLVENAYDADVTEVEVTLSVPPRWEILDAPAKLPRIPPGEAVPVSWELTVPEGDVRTRALECTVSYELADTVDEDLTVIHEVTVLPDSGSQYRWSAKPFAVGEQPVDDWGETANIDEWVIDSDADGQYLRVGGMEAERSFLRFSAGEKAVEVAVTATIKTPEGTDGPAWLYVRSTAETAVDDVHQAAFQDHETMRLAEFNQGQYTLLEETEHVNPGGVYHLRGQVTGDTIRARWWEAGTAEPDEWDLEGKTAVTEAGFVGLGHWTGGPLQLYALGVGTGGESAPAVWE